MCYCNSYSTILWEKQKKKSYCIFPRQTHLISTLTPVTVWHQLPLVGQLTGCPIAHPLACYWFRWPSRSGHDWWWDVAHASVCLKTPHKQGNSKLRDLALALTCSADHPSPVTTCQWKKKNKKQTAVSLPYWRPVHPLPHFLRLSPPPTLLAPLLQPLKDFAPSCAVSAVSSWYSSLSSSCHHRHHHHGGRNLSTISDLIIWVWKLKWSLKLPAGGTLWGKTVST